MNEKALLLAPAGSFEIFRAVIAAGADAVYAGTKRFSARAYADNFTDAEILRAMDEAHVRGKAFYPAVNTLIKDSEMGDALRTIEVLYEAGADALIVQDFGLTREIRRLFPDLKLHASTQMTATGPYGMKALEKAGFSQAVLPRELSLEEIRAVTAQTSLKTECFVHGALCYCYSGKCLMSSMIGGRSANRGRCAQPCRLPYEVLTEENAGEKRQRVGQGTRYGDGKRSGTGHGKNGSRHTKETYPLSLKDLCAAPSIPDLMDAGVSCFKIEGRMKGLEYAAGVTEIYRRLIDEAYEAQRKMAGAENPARDEHACRNDPQTQKRLQDLGSRSGFTNGYIIPEAGSRMVSMQAPSHRRDTESTAVRQVRETYTQPQEKIPARLQAYLHREEPVRLTMSAGGHAVTVTGETAQAADEHPLDEETVREKLTKLGETPFAAISCKIDLETGTFVPVSQLNRLRREATDVLLKTFRPARGGAAENAAAFCREKTDSRETAVYSGETDRRQKVTEKPILYVSVINQDQLDAVLRQPETAVVILDCDGFVPGAALERAAAQIHAAGKMCIYAMPHTFRLQTAELWRGWAARDRQCAEAGGSEPDGYEIRCIDQIAFFRDSALFPEPERLQLISGAGLYAWNASAAAFFREAGIDLITVPHELRRDEITGEGQILTIYGHAPLMISAQCVLKNSTGCRKDSDERIFLRDRKGKRFPVRRLCGSCENVIYNCVPTVLFTEAAQISKMKFSGYRMDFLRESPARIREIFGAYRGFAEGSGSQLKEMPFTYGAWKRGTQ